MIKNGNLAEEDEYVDVIEDYSYNYEGRNHRIYRTERYMVLQKRENWWQVVNLAQKVFWVPCNYLRIVKLTTQEKKDSLRATYNKKSPKQQGPHTSVQPRRKDTSYSSETPVPSSASSSSLVDHPSVVRRGRNHAAAPLSKNEISGPSTNPHLEQQQQQPPPLLQQHSASDGDPRLTITKRQQKLTKEDISSPIFVSHVGHNNNNNISSHLFNNNDNFWQQHQQLQQRASSFKPQAVARLNTGVLGSSDRSGAPASSLPSQQQSAPSIRSSRLSLYDGSGCSSDSLSDILEDGSQASSTRKKGVKSKSFDDGLSAATAVSEVVGGASNVKDINYGTNSEKASSAEQLNNRRKTADQSLFMNPLTYRNRSNSVDFKTWSKEPILGDIKTDFFDSKGGRSQGGGGGGNSKDRILWRRSLVLEESCGSQRQQQYKPILSNHDDLDASLVLDAPPDLPPKQNKNRKSYLESTTSNSGGGGRTYGVHNEPIDVRIGTLQNQDYSLRRQSLGELDFLSSHQSNQHRQQQPLSAYDSQFSSANDLPHSDRNRPYDASLMQPVINCQQISSQSGSVSQQEGERSLTPTQGSNGGGVSTTITRRETPAVLPRIVCPPPKSSTYAALPMERSNTCIGTFGKSDTESINSDSGGSQLDPAKARDDASGGGKSELKRSFKEKSGVSGRKGSLRGLFSKASSKKESQSDELPPATLFDPNKSNKKLPKTPPSPPTLHSTTCTRHLGEGWCEYWYPQYSCHYYYNESTHEKRWKPPRKLPQAAMTAPPEAFVPSRQHEFRPLASGQAPFQSQTTPKLPTSGTGSAPSSDPQAYYYQHNIQGGGGSSGGGGAGGSSGVGGGSQRSHTPLSMSMSSSVSSFLGGGGGQRQPASMDSVSSSSSSSAGLGHSYHMDVEAGGGVNHHNNSRVTGGAGALGGVVHAYDPPAELNNLGSSNYSDDKNNYSSSSNNSSNGGDRTVISKVINDVPQSYLDQHHHHSSDNIVSGSHPSGLVNIPRSRQPHPPDVGSYRDCPSQGSPRLHRQQQQLPTSSAAPLPSSTQGSSSPSMQYRAAVASSSTSIRQSPAIRITKSPPLKLPPRPPNSNTKPVLPDTLLTFASAPSTPDTPGTPDEGSPHRLFIDAAEESGKALRTALLGFKHPTGWRPRISFSKQTYENLSTGEKLVATTTEEGKIYFYNPLTNESLWQLPPLPKTTLVRSSSGCDSEGEETLPSIGSYDAASPPPPPSPVSPSHDITPNLEINNADVVRTDSLHRTYFQKEGKRTRKNWTNVHARYYVKKTDRFLSGSRSLLLFAKGPEESKINYNKCDIFDLRGQCKLSYDIDRSKSSQNNVLVLENGHRTVVLLRSSDRALIDEWFELLRRDEAVEATDLPDDVDMETGYRKDDKKSRKALEKGREPSVEKLSLEHTTIRERLLGLIKRRPAADTLVKKGIYQDSVFGCSISELCAQERTRIPLFVLRCINAIERTEDNLKADGLYRISGNGAQIQKIRFEVAKSNYQVLLDEKDVNNLTGALKLFFRELKEPLLPFNTYETFVEWSSVARRGDRQWEPLQKAVKMLPPENFSTLKVLLEHLKRVCEYSVDNRMNFMNLAIVFGPCLLWPQDTTGRDLMTEAMVHNIVVEGLLTHFDHCFRSDKK